MKIVDIIDKISYDSLLNNHVRLEMQLGIPYMELINGILCLKFLPHKQEHRDGQTFMYPCSYKIVYVYPFDKIVEFENIDFMTTKKEVEPCSLTDKKMLGQMLYYLEDLYKEYDRVLSVVEEKGSVTEVMVKKCQKMYDELINRFELTEIYNA